jgi:putative transposase
MPRMLRLEFPGALTHVMSRGIEGRDIFHDDSDRLRFLAYFEPFLARSGHKCLAWSLMNNHYHLVLRTCENPLYSLMQPLNGAYARWHNEKYGRRGYLFQSRFKSVLCQDQEYARELIRYVHLNPLRAGKVQTLNELKQYRWCGHGFVLGVKGALGTGFQERAEVLRRFGATPQAGLQGYLQFLDGGIDVSSPERSGALSHTEEFEIAGSLKGWPAVIGDPEFAQAAMQRHAVRAYRVHRQADYTHVLSDAAKQACREQGLALHDLLKRGRGDRKTAARRRFCCLACQDHLLPKAVTAKYLGVTIPAVAKMVGIDRK